MISHHLYDVTFDINRISSKTDATQLLNTAGGKPRYNYIQLGLVGTFVTLTRHQLCM